MPLSPTKELLIAVVERDGAILMRKKPAGSPPYKETWYLFGCARSTQNDANTLKTYLKAEIGIEVEVDNHMTWGTEVKQDVDGITKPFIYLNFRCTYLGGIPKVPKGAEQVKWIPIEQLREYDLVPPSVVLLTTLGYFKPRS